MSNPTNNNAGENNHHKNGVKTETHHDLSKSGGMPAVEEDLLKPLWVAEKIVERPCFVCCCCFIIVVILAVLDGLVFELSEETDRTWLVEESDEVEDYDTWVLAGDKLSDAGGKSVYTTPQTQQESDWTIQWLFELNNYNKKIDKNNPDKTDYWILTPQNLETILSYEEQNTMDPKWIDRFCYVIDTQTFECDYDSIARDVAEHFDYDFDSMTTEGIREYVWHLYTTTDSPGTIESAFNDEFSTTNQTYVYRSFLRSAMPIATNTTYIYDRNTSEIVRIIKTSKYRNDNHREDDQEDKYNDYVDKFFQDITVDHEGDLKRNGLRIIFFESTIFNDEFNVLLIEAMGWVGGAILAVLFWVTVHLQSIVLSCGALIQINLSFPAAYFIYRLILQIDHFDTLSTLIIFVLLGVGADDVFVFTDAWRQSPIFVQDPTDLKQRMSFAYRRAAKAMLVTQTTTFFAFMATSASLIMPISAFGLWAACIVLCNYILVISLYPAMLVLHHLYIRPCERKYCCCCCNDDEEEEHGNTPKSHNKKKETPRNKDESLELATNSNIKKQHISPKTAGDNGDDSDDDDGKPPAIVRRQSTVEELAVEYGALEGFFAITWSGWIQKLKWIVIALFAVIFGIAIWRATELEEQSEQEEWFEDGHYMKETLDFFDKFASSEETDLIYITILFGAKGVNRGNADRWDADDYGKIKWDKKFDLSSPEAQLYFWQACDNLTRSELVFQQTSVSCPLLNFREYLEDMGEDFPYIYYSLNGTEVSEEEQFDMFANKLYNFTLSDYSTGLNQDKLIYVEAPNTRDDGNAFVRYVAIGAYSDVRFDANLDNQRDDRDDWQDWRKDTFNNNKECPDGISRPIASSITWAWINTNEEFVRSAFQGIGIALPLALIILLISTQNWIMAIFATFDIIGVMACELGVMNIAGWKFGVSESVAIVIIIGFSVDYVVHLANAYLESTGDIRSERVSFALLTMGISVVSGALTTFLGGVFLLFPPLVFFQKMGILIMTTIVFSLAWSMFFFIALLAAFGPEYEKGHIPWCNKINQFICHRNEEEKN